MFDSIMKFLTRRGAGPSKTAPAEPFERRQVAAAALLVEAAWLDSDFAPEERQAIVRLVEERFRLTPGQAAALVAHAEKQQDEAYSGWRFIQAVREGFEPEEREQIVEMLWQVTLADGTLRPFEKQMVERVGEELDLSAQAVEAARRRTAEQITPEA